MNRATEVRLSKLEANVPAPASPFDGLTIDELSVFLLEEYSEVLASDDMPEEIRADAKRHVARITGQITETVNFASGRWADGRFRQLSGALGLLAEAMGKGEAR